ncbi:EsaB/YukD family protein [Glycomyces salinus]|uniref:EsaB/YukD family protein n=1 Tax=Glycomyces salinus TaxID=980294 RepID=UPI0018EC087F|nr:EsaB/YukD family protein [Glycomyces salinus]
MPGRYSTVTLVGPETTRDMALPGDVPVAELMPEMLRTTGVLEDHPETASVWSLTTSDGTVIDRASTLGGAAVADGQALLLTESTATSLPATVEDVRDGVEDAVDGDGVRWDPGVGRLLAVGTAGLLIGAAAFAPGTDASILLTGALVGALAVLASWWSERQHPVMTHLAITVGALWAGRLGHTLTVWAASDGAAETATRLLGALCGALLFAAVVRLGTRMASPYATGLAITTLVAAGAWSAWAHLGVDADRVAAAVLVAVLFAFAAAPRTAMFTSGMFTLDREVRGGAATSGEALRRVLERTDSRITGAVCGLAVCAGAASALLASRTEEWAAILGTAGAAALLARSRVFELVQHVAPLRAVGMLVGGFAVLGWIDRLEPLREWTPAAAVLAALAYVSVASISRSPVSASWWRRFIGVAETVLVAGMVVLAAHLWGLYAAVAAM